LVARVSQSLISSPFLIKTKHPAIRKEYLICGVKDKKDFWKSQKIYSSISIILPVVPVFGPPNPHTSPPHNRHLMFGMNEKLDKRVSPLLKLPFIHIFDHTRDFSFLPFLPPTP
jgi:hypothetical protein